MGTAIFALASNTVIELNTRAIIGAALMTVIIILAIAYFRHNQNVVKLLFLLFIVTVAISTGILFVTALDHVNTITYVSLGLT